MSMIGLVQSHYQEISTQILSCTYNNRQFIYTD